MLYKKLATISFLVISSITIAQQKKRKTVATTRIETAPKIDGNLDDNAWENVKACTGFIELRPNNGKKVDDTYATEVKVVYDDAAVYISAKMLDPEPHKIPKQFASRDNFSQADFFLVTINPNDDGQNPFEFIVQTTGNQADAKISNGDEDFNWSAVWDSDVKITDYGWNVEMKLPYRALRFSNQPIQSWGFNFHRRLERLNIQHSWTHIDNTKGGWTQYDGLITNFKNIKPPTRLNLYPYASAITKVHKGKTEFDWSAGMDIKYGLSENFTLDATLIPDFSQAGFDNVTLNLGPFEQQFSEQRQFFTEGTELFTKGGLFYSRRIGGDPIDQFSDERKDDDAFVNNKKVNDEIDKPEKVNMLNAIKISGRAKNGLGLGFFNAITETTEATVTRTTKEIIGLDTIATTKNYTTVVSPLSNYNILVADYQFNQNSAITLINTNVIRDGRFKDANATGFLWHIEDKTSTYNIDGSFKLTHVTGIENPKTGYNFDTSIGKQAGNWFWELGYNFENKDYDPNDMGILFSNNEQTIYGNIGYQILQPKGQLNRLRFNFWNNAQFQHHSGIFMGYRAGINIYTQVKPRLSLGGNIRYFSRRKDFNEPRHSKGNLGGVFFKRPEGINFNHWGSTSYTKKFAVDYNFYQTLFINDKRHSYGFEFKPRYRFNNQFSVIYGFKYSQTDKDLGYADKKDDKAIYFGQRDRVSYNNTISGKYNFSTKSSLSLSFRHNWSKVTYDGNYFALGNDSSLINNTTFKDGKNINFNSWNLDLNYLWQFAPGSQLVALYRNSIFSKDENTNLNFTNNLEQLFSQPNKHIFSIRLVYFIDYNQLKNIF